MPAVAAQGHTGTDFGQDLTKKEQEFFVAGPDLVDREPILGQHTSEEIPLTEY